MPQYEGTEEEQDAAEKEDADRIADAVDQAIDQVQSSRDRGEHNQPEIAEGLMGASRRNGGTASATDWRSELADRLTRDLLIEWLLLWIQATPYSSILTE